MVFVCSKHLIRTIREISRPPHRMVMVQPARTGDVCECGAKAAWGVSLQ